MYKILIVEDDLEMQRLYRFFLTEVAPSDLAFESKPDRVYTAIETFQPDLIILDLSLGGQSVESLIKTFSQRGKIPQIIVLTANDSVSVAVSAMRAGAFNYLVKPVEKNAFLAAVEHALDYVNSLKELIKLRQRVLGEQHFPNIITNSPAMLNVLQLTTDLAQTDFSVLLQGESGTGKELIARSLHEKSNRKSQPFVAVNCAALPDTLVESELFGYEKGAFTGATQRHLGKFEQADGGTIFLDEIGDMGINAQSRLLRALQEGEIFRLGGTEAIRVDVRVVAATNKNLKKAILAKTFREDLYYRLSVFPIQIPPLRERKEDIINLLHHFLNVYRQEGQVFISEFSREAIEVLESYGWPGNVRELQNVARRLSLTVESHLIQVNHLPGEMISEQGQSDRKNTSQSAFSLGTLADLEKQAILKTLEDTQHQIAPAAKKLGIGRSTLYRKMERYGIHLPQSRE